MPKLYVIGGPNGAGKTTIALRLLPALSVFDFVNADNIATGLSPLRPEQVGMYAGRLMLGRLHTLSEAGASFGFESTLASRSFAPFLRTCRERGYDIHLLYISLRSAGLAVARVESRVRAGGHAIPEATVRRRYEASRKNFVSLYKPLADNWRLYDNTLASLHLIAEGGMGQTNMFDADLWSRFHD